MSFRKAWKVYGAEGHRMKESFGKSTFYDFSNNKVGTRVIVVWREDVLETNDFVVVAILRNTEKECDKELFAQLSDGIFENCRTGKIEELENFREEVEI